MQRTIIFILFSALFFLQASCEKNQTTQMNPTPPIPPITTPETISYLALGDSYTIGHSVSESERWPVELVQQLRNANIENVEMQDAQIIAKTGWATGDLQSSMDQAELENNFGLVSLLIGVNNQYRGYSIEAYEEEFETLLLRAIELAKGNKDRVFVLSIPDYGATPFGQSNAETIGEEIDAFNAVNRTITEKYEVKYFDITPISRQAVSEPNLVANDGLHPSGKMYELWVELILEEVKMLIAN